MTVQLLAFTRVRFLVIYLFTQIHQNKIKQKLKHQSWTGEANRRKRAQEKAQETDIHAETIISTLGILRGRYYNAFRVVLTA